jgi:hypothetical protein
LRKLIIASIAAGALAIGAAPAFAGAGPNGTSETGNNVDCGTQGQNVGGFQVSGLPSGPPSPGPGAIVVCNSGGAPGLQGRIILAGTSGPPPDGYIAADGDASNDARAQGYIRVGNSGVKCGNTAADPGTDDTDSANPVADNGNLNPTGQGPSVDGDCDPR